MSKASKWKTAVAATALATTFLTIGLPGTAATLYRWTDANGTPVISDRPPPQGTAYTTSESGRYAPPRPDSTTGSNVTTPSVSKSAAGAMVTVDPSKAGKTEITPGTEEQCASIKDEIFKLETFARIRQIDPESGEAIFMTDAQRQERLDKAIQFQSERC